MNKKTTALLLCFGLASGVVRAELQLPSVFSSGMVLQRGMPVPVWGKADPGAEITVEFGGQKKTAVANGNGRWRVNLDPMQPSFEPRTLSCTSSIGNQKSAIGNVVVGEVWVLAGQSNMWWPVIRSKGGEAAAAQADYPWLRFFAQEAGQWVRDEPERDVKGGRWEMCTPDTARGVSGVGFFFARELHSLLGTTPLALIRTSRGGTYAECWMDFQTLEKTPSTHAFLKKAELEIKPGESDSKGFWGDNNFRRPAGLYHTKIAPLQPFAVRGVLWYQGEGNSKDWLAPVYAETLSALIRSWRERWERPDMPFFIVQLPLFRSGKDTCWPLVRSAQARVANELPNVELAVTLDCGEETKIHPPDKQPVGARLARLAAATVYSLPVPYRSPHLRSSEIKNGSVWVRLGSADGLFFKGAQAKGFEICGAEGRFIPAEAEIAGEGLIRIYSSSVQQPVAARYAWFNWGEISLFNQHGLPAAPFSTERNQPLKKSF